MPNIIKCLTSQGQRILGFHHLKGFRTQVSKDHVSPWISDKGNRPVLEAFDNDTSIRMYQILPSEWVQLLFLAIKSWGLSAKSYLTCPRDPLFRCRLMHVVHVSCCNMNHMSFKRFDQGCVLGWFSDSFTSSERSRKTLTYPGHSQSPVGLAEK